MKERQHLNQHKKKGFVLTTELMLLITAIIIVASVVAYAMGMQMVNQASSQKQTLVVDRADVYYLNSNTLAVTVWVENLGSTSISISLISAQYGTNGGSCSYSAGVSSTINPGDTVPLSATLSLQNCNSGVQPGESVYVYVTSSSGQAGVSATVMSP